MSNANYHEALNELLINLGKSLLQYLGEAWPWTGESATEEQAILTQLVEEQKNDIQNLSEYLWNEHWPIDFGTYPTEYTDLHYISLDFLIKQLEENSSNVLQAVRDTLQTCEVYPQATPLLKDVLARETHICEQVSQLAKKASSPAS